MIELKQHAPFTVTLSDELKAALRQEAGDKILGVYFDEEGKALYEEIPAELPADHVDEEGQPPAKRPRPFYTWRTDQ